VPQVMKSSILEEAERARLRSPLSLEFLTLTSYNPRITRSGASHHVALTGSIRCGRGALRLKFVIVVVDDSICIQ
jgi:hypothetical protein